MSYLIGNKVRLKVEKKSNGWLRLIEKGERYPPDEIDCFFKYAEICGIYQMRTKDLVVIIDFDPHSLFSFQIETWHQKGYDIADKWVGSKGAYINHDHIWPTGASAPAQQVRLNAPGGMACKLCKKFIQYAGVNRDDGTFACKKCRETKGYLLKCKPLA